MLGSILNSHKKVKLTDRRGVWIRVWGLIEKDGTYLCGRCDGWWRKMVLTVLQVFFIYILEVIDRLCV